MTSSRLSRGDYFDVAFEILGESGFPALTASAVCDRMGITRGSFYHHFQSFDVFVDDLLTHWEQQFSRELIARTAGIADLTEQLRMQAQLAMSLPHDIEVVLRAWGTVNAAVGAALRRVDQLRRDAVARSLSDHGLVAGDAEIAAELFLDTLIGAQMTGTAPARMVVMFDRIAPTMSRVIGAARRPE